MLTGIPALRALARTTGSLTVAMPAALAPLLELAGIDAEVHDARGLDRALPRADLGVNLHGRGPQSHRLLLAAAPDLVAFGNDEAGVAGPRWRAEEHERERWCRLLREALAIPADPFELRLAAPPSPAPGAVVVHPGAAKIARRWPAERWAAVVRHLAEAGERVALTGSEQERSLAEQVDSLSGVPVALLAGATDVTVLAGLVAHARGVVAGDTGVGHFAPAYGVPSVHLFGPTPPSRWGPPPGPHTVLWHGRVGDPHGALPDPGLLRLSVEEVSAAVDHMIATGPGTP